MSNSSAFSAMMQNNISTKTNASDIDSKSFQSTINGHWVEDQNKRENINNYLYEMGMNWFKRKYATSTSWEDELHIHVENGILRASGIRGPLAESFQFTIKLDNQTLAEMDIGNEFGGLTNATAEIRNNSVIAYVLRPGYSDILFVVKDTISLNNTDVLMVENKHYDSNVVWKSVYNRK